MMSLPSFLIQQEAECSACCLSVAGPKLAQVLWKMDHYFPSLCIKHDLFNFACVCVRAYLLVCMCSTCMQMCMYTKEDIDSVAQE